jgi:hypothetical protein
MKFLKDAIREKHIWKDVERGKRSQNYNQKAKTQEMCGYQQKTMDMQ